MITLPMTRDEALAEARIRYGPEGWVTFNEEGRYQVGVIVKDTPGYRQFAARGEAWQGWEEAFADADRKS